MEKGEKVNPKMVTLARQSQGMTQSQLAAKASIPQARISKIEAGLIEASEEVLNTLSVVLKYPESFFVQTDSLFGFETSVLFHRKREQVGAKILERIHAEVNIRRMQIDRLWNAVDLSPVRQFPRHDIDEFDGSPAKIAQAVRAAWVLPRGPVENVTEAIERAGGIVVQFNFGTRLIDAISQWIPNLGPIFFVSKDIPGDRLRWSLAHEIGHVVMHSTIGPDIEDQANQFAAEFLMPATDIKMEFRGVNIARLAMLKPVWKVAMSALLRRALSLRTISERNARYIFMQFSKAGYRLREPEYLDVEIEKPTLLKRVINLHREALNYSVSDLASLVNDNEAAVRANYLGQQALRVVSG